jgi:50S ribosomal protein L16 3-hydroxylase
MLDLGIITTDAFFASYWRTKPLLMKGVAPRIAGVEMGFDRFHVLARELQNSYSPLFFGDGRHLTFVQNLDLVAGDLRNVSESLGRQFAGISVWFDGVFAEHGHSIGSHYDVADAFVIQQKGCKVWHLHSPKAIHRSRLRMRMLNENVVDTMKMPPGPLEFNLEEGDVLYIPLFWIHCGRAVGRTLSISLSFTARNLLSCLRTVLGTVGGIDGVRRAVAQKVGSADLKRALWKSSFPFRNVMPPVVLFEDPGTAMLRRQLSRSQAWWRPLPVLRRRNDAIERARAHAQLDDAISELRRVVLTQ